MSGILGQNGKPMRLVAALHTTPFEDTDLKPVTVCDHPNDAVPVAEFMVSEMKKNPFTPEGKQILMFNSFDPKRGLDEWNALPWYKRLVISPSAMSGGNGMAASQKPAAYALWTKMVAPGRPWDHKPILRQKFRPGGKFTPWHKYGQYDYYYDIWSNIHYGYVGIAVGFTGDELINGAAIAQIADDKLHGRPVQNHPENGAWPATGDDIQDHTSIQLGIDLYAAVKPAALTVGHLLDRIAAVPVPWGDAHEGAKRIHLCEHHE